MEIAWSVFEPLAQNLEHLHLNQWAIRSMERSGIHFTLSLVSLRMSQFGLPTIPKSVLSTLTPRDPIAPSLAQQPTNRDWNFWTPKFCPSSSNCSCCEMKDFLEWAGKINKPTSQRPVSVLFMCGGANGVNYNQTSQFPLDLHAQCAEPVKISKPVVCYKPPPIKVECTGNLHVTTSEPNLRRTDAASLSVSADSSFRCRTFLYNIHSKILQMAEEGKEVNQTAPRTVTATCNNGMISADMFDAYAADVTKLTFDSDASTNCRDKFDLFLNFVYAQKDPQTLYEDVVPTIIPVDRWINEFQICSDTPPLTLSCNGAIGCIPEN
ncbi:uncharacterized protein LOC129584381 [Paramacrobiotus metropolitanus]|uniref:uncharacterized protein LOC129584381 n=1 Tax=Paramacrobiotus metropolitanus TaxID=2943436 RepID=UPI0024464456|nr:uncharacterized protein LOC129584381 [Paramacrobiotus metropolitanus]